MVNFDQVKSRGLGGETRYSCLSLSFRGRVQNYILSFEDESADIQIMVEKT